MFSRSRQGLMLAALLVLTFIPTAAAESISVRMTEPFEVDGQMFQYGTLTLREVSDFTPVATMNEVCVGRDCFGLFMARERDGSPDATRNELIFTRAAEGHLVLEGLAMAGGPTRDLRGLGASRSAGQGDVY